MISAHIQRSAAAAHARAVCVSASQAPPRPRRPRLLERWAQARAERGKGGGEQARRRPPGDSGFDLFRLRKRDRKAFRRMQEVEVIHARWAMLGVLSLIISDAAGPARDPAAAAAAAAAGDGGVWAWLGSGAAVPWVAGTAVLLAIVETYRMTALWGEEDVERRAYPGDRFDPFGLTKPHRRGAPAGVGVWAPWLGGVLGWLAGGWWWAQRDMTRSELDAMKSRELRNGRLAMVSFAGVCLAGLATGKGPITLLIQHLRDPLHNTILQTLGAA